MDRQITCITKPDRFSRHEHITQLGGIDGSGQRWYYNREEVIRRIDNRTDRFWVIDPLTARRANVEVIREVGKAPYVRTRRDGILTDNLLSLSPCP